MITGIQHLHSSMRYVLLALLIFAVLTAWQHKLKKQAYSKKLDKATLWVMILSHIQLLLGFVLYVTSPKVLISDMAVAMKNSGLRFYTVEHILGMIIAITLITVGRIQLKKMKNDEQKNQKVFLFYGIALIIIFLSIPWPFLKDFGTWF